MQMCKMLCISSICCYLLWSLIHWLTSSLRCFRLCSIGIAWLTQSSADVSVGSIQDTALACAMPKDLLLSKLKAQTAFTQLCSTAGVPLSSAGSIGRAGQNGARAGLEQPQGSSVRPGQKGLRAVPAQPQGRSNQPSAPGRQRSSSPEAERRRKVLQHDRLSPEAERRRKAHARENRSSSPEAERRQKAQHHEKVSPEAERRRKAHAQSSRSLSPEAERRRKAHEKANRSGRDSARSDNSSEAVPAQNGNSPRALAPSRLGPGREKNRQMAAAQDAARPSKKGTQRVGANVCVAHYASLQNLRQMLSNMSST